MIDFTKKLIALRKAHPTFHRRRFFEGRPIHGEGVKDILWLKPDGTEMVTEDWQNGFARVFGMYLNGKNVGHGLRGEQVSDSSFLMLCNAGDEPMHFHVPKLDGESQWARILDTSLDDSFIESALPTNHRSVKLEYRALVLLASKRQ